MTVGERTSRRYVAAWFLLAAGLCLVVTTWGSALVRVVEPTSPSGRPMASPPANAGAFLAAPTIVTDYTKDGSASTDALCAQLSPTPTVVTVETPAGKVVSTIRCSTVNRSTATPLPDDQCIYVESPDGGQSVLSAKTGSLLSRAQAANCTK